MRSSLLAGVLVYAGCIGFAGAVTGYGIHRVAEALIGSISPPATVPERTASPVAAKAGDKPVAPAAGPTVVVREASMVPTQDRWNGANRRQGANPYRSYGGPPQFGSSSRGYTRPRGFFESLFGGRERPEPPRSNAYRTLCVRMCDGFYFPVSFSATPERFERDARVCESSCGTQARLFVYRNPGGDIEDMEDLSGRPYKQMRTAFLYRTEYVANCKCQPDPWETEAKDRHRVYALTAAKRKGDKAAAAELEQLQAKIRQAQTLAKTAGLTSTVTDSGSSPGLPATRSGAVTGREGEYMRLGAEARKAVPPRETQRPNRDSHWTQRSFWRDF